jgi:phosphatidate phosphatase LPIN
MEALVLWREAALTKDPQVSSRPVSPTLIDDRELGSISGEELISANDKSNTAAPISPVKPSSLSWVRWWSRSRRSDAVRPELRAAVSAPSNPVCSKCFFTFERNG